MKKFGTFEIIGAAITTIGLMFLVIFALSYSDLVPMQPVSYSTAVISLLMATNGYMIFLIGVVMKGTAAVPRVLN